MSKLHYLSASEILSMVREGSLSVQKLVSDLLERIDEVNSKINGLVHFDREEIISQAKRADGTLSSGKDVGPLHGLPITIKDNIETAGLVTTGGIKGRERYVPSFDASVVQRLKPAGAIIVGKTNCPAFCAGFETENDIYGRTNNPYNLTKRVGSSSGGEAALVAAGGSYIGIGSDTGGSIKWPASFCGVCGLIPTFGRVPRTGTIPPYLGFLETTQIGPLARTVEDLVLILPVIMGPDNWDSKCVPMPFHDPNEFRVKDMKIAYYTENGFVEPEREVQRTLYQAADVLAKVGFEMEEKYPPATTEFLSLSKGLNGFTKDVDPDTMPSIHEQEESVELYPSSVLDLADDWLQRSQRAQGTKAMLAVEFFFWGIKLDAYRSKILSFLESYDAIVCPVSGRTAFDHGESNEENFNPLDLLSYTHPYSFVGLPAVTLRCGTSSDGPPIGVQIITQHAKEGLALKLALQLEDKMGAYQPPGL
jgi:amidase